MSAVKKSHDAKTSTPANLSQARDGSVASSLDVGENPAVGKVSTEEQGADVSVQHKSAFVSFLGQLSSFSGDLRYLMMVDHGQFYYVPVVYAERHLHPWVLVSCLAIRLTTGYVSFSSASYNDHPKYLAEITNSPVPEGIYLFYFNQIDS